MGAHPGCPNSAVVALSLRRSRQQIRRPQLRRLSGYLEPCCLLLLRLWSRAVARRGRRLSLRRADLRADALGASLARDQVAPGYAPADVVLGYRWSLDALVRLSRAAGCPDPACGSGALRRCAGASTSTGAVSRLCAAHGLLISSGGLWRRSQSSPASGAPFRRHILARMCAFLFGLASIHEHLFRVCVSASVQTTRGKSHAVTRRPTRSCSAFDGGLGG